MRMSTRAHETCTHAYLHMQTPSCVHQGCAVRCVVCSCPFLTLMHICRPLPALGCTSAQDALQAQARLQRFRQCCCACIHSALITDTGAQRMGADALAHQVCGVVLLLPQTRPRHPRSGHPLCTSGMPWRSASWCVSACMHTCMHAWTHLPAEGVHACV